MKKVFITLAVLGSCIYSNTLNFAFVFDDLAVIVLNPVIRSLDLAALWQAFNTRALVGLSLAFNYALGKENVTGYHAFNILVHIFNSFLVYQLVRLTFVSSPKSLIGDQPKHDSRQKHAGMTSLAFFAALIFLAHPIQTQAVTYIWQRSTSLAAFFYIGALYFYVRGRLARHPEAKPKDLDSSATAWPQNDGGWNYGLCLLFTVLGMFTKEIVFTLPFAIALYELIFLRGLSSPPANLTPGGGSASGGKSLVGDQPKHDSRQKHAGMTVKHTGMTLVWILLASSLLIIPLTLAVGGGPSALRILRPEVSAAKPVEKILAWDRWLDITKGVEKEKIPRGEYLLTEVNVLRTYLRLLVFPANQNVDYDYPRARFLREPNTLLSLALLLSLLGAGLFLLKKRPLAAFGILWFFLTLSVESSIAQREFIFEHRLYLPMAGFAFIAADIAGSLLTEKNGRWMTALAVLLILSYSVLSYQRNFVWKDEISLWSDAIEKSPNKLRPYKNRASAYQRKGLPDLAFSDYSRAIELRPEDPDNADSYSNRCSLYGMGGSLDKALMDCDKAVELGPAFAAAYNNRAIIHKMKGDLDRALEDYDRAIQLEPDFAIALNNREAVYRLKAQETQL